MYVASLAIDRFGNSHDLRIDGLSSGMNVVIGPNPAANATLLSFIRSALYGFTPAIRDHYQPSESDRFGGSVTLFDGQRTHAISRYDDGQPVGGISDEIWSALGNRAHRGDLPIELLEQIYVVDLSSAGHLDSLCDQAQQFGIAFDDYDHGRPRRDRLQRDLAQLRHSLPPAPPRQSRPTLESHRASLNTELVQTESLWHRQLSQREQYDRLLPEADQLERRLSEIRATIRQLQDSQSQLQKRQTQLEQELASLPSPAETNEGGVAWDERLSHWQQTLRELNDLQNVAAPWISQRVVGGAQVEAELHDPRQSLRDLEQQAEQFQRLLADSSATSPASHSLFAACTTHAAELRQKVHQLCHTLNLWQTYYEQRLASYEHEQCQRSQQELRHAIELLSERRQRQIRQSSVEHCLRADHESLCDCASHPRGKPLSPSSGHREEILRSLRASEDEVRQLVALIDEKQELERVWTARLAEIRGSLPVLRDERALQLTLKDLREQLADVEQSLIDWDHWNATSSQIQAIERELTALPVSQTGVWRTASNHLETLTEGRLNRLGRTTAGEVWVESSTGERSRPHDLSPAASHQVVLAISVALAEACEQRGVRLPLAIDGTPEFSSAASAENFFRWLARIGRDRQVICCTSDEWLAHAARELCLVSPLHMEQFPVRHGSIAGYDIPSHRGVSTATYSPVATSRLASADTSPTWDESDDIESIDFFTTSQRNALRGIGIYVVRAFLNADADELSRSLPGIGFASADWAWRQRRCRQQTRSVRYERPLPLRDESVRHERPLHARQESWPLQGRQTPAGLYARRDEDYGSHERLDRNSDDRKVSDQQRLDQQRVDHNRQAVAAHQEPEYSLHRKDPVVDAPTIGPSLAKKLEAFGIHTVDDLLHASADSVATQLNMARVSRNTVQEWQHQAALCCDVVALRGQDAQLLVAADVTDASQIAQHTADSLHQKLADFANTKVGKRWLRGAPAPTLDEVTTWIASAKSPRISQAA